MDAARKNAPMTKEELRRSKRIRKSALPDEVLHMQEEEYKFIDEDGFDPVNDSPAKPPKESPPPTDNSKRKSLTPKTPKRPRDPIPQPVLSPVRGRPKGPRAKPSPKSPKVSTPQPTTLTKPKEPKLAIEEDSTEVDDTKVGFTEVDDFYIFCSKDDLRPEVPFLDDIANATKAIFSMKNSTPSVLCKAVEDTLRHITRVEYLIKYEMEQALVQLSNTKKQLNRVHGKVSALQYVQAQNNQGSDIEPKEDEEEQERVTPKVPETETKHKEAPRVQTAAEATKVSELPQELPEEQEESDDVVEVTGTQDAQGDLDTEEIVDEIEEPEKQPPAKAQKVERRSPRLQGKAAFAPPKPKRLAVLKRFPRRMHR